MSRVVRKIFGTKNSNLVPDEIKREEESQGTNCQAKLEPSQQGETVSPSVGVAGVRTKFTTSMPRAETTKTKTNPFYCRIIGKPCCRS